MEVEQRVMGLERLWGTEGAKIGGWNEGGCLAWRAGGVKIVPSVSLSTSLHSLSICLQKCSM